MLKSQKMNMTTAAVVAKKQALDNDIRELMELRAQRLALAKREAAIKERVESQYTLDAATKEVLQGLEMYAEKVPSKRNVVWSYAELSVLIAAVKKAGVDIELDQVATQRIVTDVNTKPLNRLVKDGVVPQEAIDKCFTCDYTFSSKYGALTELGQ